MYELVHIDKTRDNVTIVTPHRHVFYELFYVRTGYGSYIYNGKEYPFSPGSIFISKPGQMHYETSSSGYGNYYLFFKSFFIHDDQPFYTIHDNEEKHLLSLIETLYTIRNDESKQLLSQALFESLHQYVRIIMPSSTSSVPIEQLLRNIEENFRSSDFNLDTSNLSFCSDHVRKTFTKVIGQTPLQYLISMRVNYAKKLISEQNNLSLKEIAFASGYSDYYYFSRQFKQHTGVSPKEWGKQSPYSN